MTESMCSALSRLLRECWKYFLVSIAALVLDYGLLIGLTECLGFHYLLSAATGFMTGSIFSYILSVSFVFDSRSVKSRPKEFGSFCAIGVFGLLLNESVIALVVNEIGASYVIAKVPAAALSFLFNFGVRRWVLFSNPKRPPQPA